MEIDRVGEDTSTRAARKYYRARDEGKEKQTSSVKNARDFYDGFYSYSFPSKKNLIETRRLSNSTVRPCLILAEGLG